MPTRTLEFAGHHGTKLAGRLDLPEGRQLATALFAHCFSCGKDSIAARRISSRLAALGIAVLRFDFSGLGHSGGEFESTGLGSNVGDLVAAAAALSDQGMPPRLLIGHSLGGAAAIRAAARIPGLRALAALGTPFDPAHALKQLGDAAALIRKTGTAEVTLGERRLRIGRQLVDDLCKGDLGPDLQKLRAALLVVHAPRDAVVGIENAGQIFAAARHPKSFISLDGADHLISGRADAEYAAGVIAAWAARYLDLDSPAPPPGVPEGITRIREADADGFLQDVTSGHHHLLADEPRAYGGSNAGFTPYGLVAAGLGACTSMTIRMYARRKGWKLEHVEVDVSHAKVHAQDCDGCDADARLDSFRREIRLEGDLDDGQRARLLQVAERCPVHRTLSIGARIETVLAEPVTRTAAATAG